MPNNEKKKGSDLSEGTYGWMPEAKSRVVCHSAARLPEGRREQSGWQSLHLSSSLSAHGPAGTPALCQPAGAGAPCPPPRVGHSCSSKLICEALPSLWWGFWLSMSAVGNAWQRGRPCTWHSEQATVRASSGLSKLLLPSGWCSLFLCRATCSWHGTCLRRDLLPVNSTFLFPNKKLKKNWPRWFKYFISLLPGQIKKLAWLHWIFRDKGF